MVTLYAHLTPKLRVKITFYWELLRGSKLVSSRKTFQRIFYANFTLHDFFLWQQKCHYQNNTPIFIFLKLFSLSHSSETCISSLMLCSWTFCLVPLSYPETAPACPSFSPAPSTCFLHMFYVSLLPWNFILLLLSFCHSKPIPDLRA